MSAEPAIALLLLRALTMEVAHAKVGAGVTDHSSFESQPLARAWTTADTALRLVWGPPDVARGAARQVYRFHDHVHGALREPVAGWAEGAPYTAHDASLLLWVWATLVEVTHVAHARWLHPLDGAEAERFYRDMSNFARFFGIPAAMIPPDRHEFAAYFEAMIAGDELTPTPTSASMVRRVLWFRHPRVPAFAVRAGRVLAIGTLDPRIRERFGLRLGQADHRLFTVIDGSLRQGYRYRPAWLFQLLPSAYVGIRSRAARAAAP